MLDRRSRQFFVQQQRVRPRDTRDHGDAIGRNAGAQMLEHDAHRDSGFLRGIGRAQDAGFDSW